MEDVFKKWKVSSDYDTSDYRSDVEGVKKPRYVLNLLSLSLSLYIFSNTIKSVKGATFLNVIVLVE